MLYLLLDFSPQFTSAPTPLPLVLLDAQATQSHAPVTRVLKQNTSTRRPTATDKPETRNPAARPHQR